jgi:copper homeostasis protein
MTVRVEIAVQDVAGLEVAARNGADRVELCVDLDRGGVTPPTDLVAQCADRARELVAAQRARPGFDVHVLIRPRAGEGDFREVPDEFVYTPAEVDLMARQAADVVEAGAAGVVIGALTADGDLDVRALEQVRDAALDTGTAQLRSVHLTCHRCVDALAGAEAREAAVLTLLGLGFHRVLTSGGAASAPEGTADLARMVRAADDLVDVCAGGGIRPVHVPDLVRATGVPDIHLSARSASAAGADAATATDPAVVQAAVDAAGEL